MSEESLVKMLIRLHHYLKAAIPAPYDFKDEIVDILKELDCNLIRTATYHLITSTKKPASWFFSYIATYSLDKKRISVEVVAYLDKNVVRFLKIPSCLKFDDSIPESEIITPQDLVKSHFISERYILPYDTLLHPKKARIHSQRLLKIIDTILRSKECAQGFEDLLRLLLELLELCKGDQGTDITYILDELLILMDDFTLQDTSLLTLLKWKRLITAKVQLLIIQIDPERKAFLYYRRRLILIGLLLVTPFIPEGANFQASLLSLQEGTNYMTNLTLGFLDSLLDEMETSVLMNTHLERYLMWESSLVTFFAYNQDACFCDSLER